MCVHAAETRANQCILTRLCLPQKLLLEDNMSVQEAKRLARWGDMAPRMRALNKQTSQKGDLGHKRPSVQKRLKSLLWVRSIAAACLLVKQGWNAAAW